LENSGTGVSLPYPARANSASSVRCRIGTTRLLPTYREDGGSQLKVPCLMKYDGLRVQCIMEYQDGRTETRTFAQVNVTSDSGKLCLTKVVYIYLA